VIKRSSDNTNIGLLINEQALKECPDESERLSEKIKCRVDYGITWPLPLDMLNCDETCEEP
jgi:hypothetical protein